MESSHDRKAGNEENGQVPSFNSVTQHYQTIMGSPTQKVDMSKMPRPLRFLVILRLRSWRYAWSSF